MKNFFTGPNNKIQTKNSFFKINPHNHWNFLLKIFFILVSVLIIFSLYLLYEIKNEQIFQVTVEQQENPTILKEDLLKKTIEVYNKKSSKILEINNNFSVYSDPSL